MAGRRGRRTIEDLQWQAGVPIIPGQGIKPPSAPADLAPEEAKLWRAIVNRLQPSYFAVENLPLLKSYVRHSVIADTIAERIKQLRQIVPMNDAGLNKICDLSRDLGQRALPTCHETAARAFVAFDATACHRRRTSTAGGPGALAGLGRQGAQRESDSRTLTRRIEWRSRRSKSFKLRGHYRALSEWGVRCVTA
jgi:hypothetical protein